MTPAVDPARESETLHIARQPILDERGRVFGYELLYRHAAHDVTCTADGVVLELLESVAVDSEVVDVCRHLHARGYRLALDDFVEGSAAESLLAYASFVKVDVLATPPETVTALAARLSRAGVRMLAEKVETREVFEHTRRGGYSLFQGYYFCRPQIQHGAALPAQQLAYLRLLAALSKPNLMTAEVERLVKQDVSLSLRVLRSVNSAGYPIRTEIRSIAQALLLLGIEPIRKWTTVWCLAGLSAGATPELATLALMRARTCELLGEMSAVADSSELFLVGLFSLLDVMLSRTMADAVEGLPLSAAAIGALEGNPNLLRSVLDTVIAYERGEWDEAASLAAASGLTPAALADAHTGALKWVQDAARIA